MNLDLSPELRAFRDEVRAFVRAVKGSLSEP